jgi:hypothetical protein
MHRRTPLLVALAALGALASAAPAQAGPPGKWTQVTGVAGQEDLNTLRVGLLRTSDGVLHVGWMRAGPGNAGTILHSSVSADAKTVSGPDSVFTYPGGANESVVLVRAPEGIRAFFAGLAEGSAVDRAMATAVSTDGRTWTPPLPASRAGSSAKPVYVASGLGAGAGLDGTFFAAWGDSEPGGGGFHVGLDPTAADSELPAGLQRDPGIGVDSASGQVFLAWNDLDASTVAVMGLSPSGSPVTLPNSAAAQLQHPVGITGRIGAPGVFIAYTQGTNPFLGDPSLYRVDTGKATKLTTRDGEQVSIAAAPSGRLWVFWKKAATVFARHSNKAATKFGATRKLSVPGGRGSTIFSLAGEGSRGPLDLLVLVDPPSAGIANFHQRVLPGLTLAAKQKKSGKTAFKVTDAGAPVAGAKVKVKGDGTKTTGAAGSVLFSLSKGKHGATATKKGYASAKATARVG